MYYVDNMADLKNSKKNNKQMLNSELDTLLDEFDGQFDLLNFENNDFFPIEYNLDKLLNQFSSTDSKTIEITFKEDSKKNSLTTDFSPVEFEKHFERISSNCEKHLYEVGLVNTYISLGFIKYGDNIAPSLFIPVFIKKNQHKYVILRNYNQNIQFNILLKIVLKEDYGINLPEFDGDVKKLISQLRNVDEIEYQKSAYVSNFDLRFNHIFLDLNFNEWDDFDEKFNQFQDGSLCNFHEFTKFKQNLLEYSKALEIHDDYLFLKSLLSKNKLILVIGDNSIRNKVKNNFYMIDSESLILDLSDDLSKEEFHEAILDNNLIHNTEVVNHDNLVKKHSQIRTLVKSINQDYSFLSPKQIKENKEYYLKKINELQLKNFTCELTDVSDYDELTYKKIENQIINLFSNKNSIYRWFKYFSLYDLSSNKFNSYINVADRLEHYLKQFSNFNNYLNKRYSIKIFDDLLSIDVLKNLDVLGKSANYINSEKIIELNKFIKDYYRGNIVSENKNIINDIDNDIKYTELLNNEIIDENKIDLIKKDFKNVIKYTNYFIDFSNFLIKEFNYIFDFYNQFDFFDIDIKLLKINNSIDELNKLFFCFKNHVDKLINFKEIMDSKVLNRDVENFIEFIFENDFNENEITILYRFNFYNSILNNFLNDNNHIDEEKILSAYESELTSIEKKLNMHNQNLLFQKIYSKPIELNNAQKVLNQKNEFINDFQDDKKSIRELLDKYKDFITANKRIFLMDISLVSQFLSNSYENYFDNVIITDDLKYKLDELSLLLRSKNKIILIKGDNHE